MLTSCIAAEILGYLFYFILLFFHGEMIIDMISVL